MTLVKEVAKESLQDTIPSKEGVYQGTYPQLSHYYMCGYCQNEDERRPHLVAVYEITDNGKMIIGFNSHGEFENPFPKIPVNRKDVIVYQMLIKSITESNVKVQGTTTNLCKEIDPRIFASFKRTSKFKAFGEASNKPVTIAFLGK